MNRPTGRTVNTAVNKQTRLSAALALVVGLVLGFPGGTAALAPAVGLALAFSGTAALAASNPIPGVDIIVREKPGGSAITTKTGPDGSYQFRGLVPGQFDLSVQGQPVQTITVGPDGSVRGLVSREPDGKAKITFNGQSAGAPLPSVFRPSGGTFKKGDAPVSVGDLNQDGRTDLSTKKPTIPGVTAK